MNKVESFIKKAVCTALLSFLGIAHAGAQDVACLQAKIKAITDLPKEWKTSPIMGISCDPGHVMNFGYCKRPNDGYLVFPFQAPEAWTFDPDTTQFIESSRAGHAKTNYAYQMKSPNMIQVALSCSPHGCGGEGRVWIEGYVSVKAKRIVTPDENKSFMRDCGFCIFNGQDICG